MACAQSLVSVLAPVVREWHHRHPKVTITLRESTSAEELHGFIDADEADVVLMPAPVPDRFTATVVADEEIVLAAPTDHPIARQPVVRVQDLDGVRLVHFAPDNGLSTWLDRSLTKAGVRPEPVMRTSVTVAAPQLAAMRPRGRRMPGERDQRRFPGRGPIVLTTLGQATGGGHPNHTRPARRAVHRQHAQARRARAPRRANSTRRGQLDSREGATVLLRIAPPRR